MRRNATLKGRCVEKKRGRKERKKKRKEKEKKKKRDERKRERKLYHIEHRKATACIIKTSRLV